MSDIKLFCDTIDTSKGEFIITFNETGIYEVLFPGRLLAEKVETAKLPWPDLAEDFKRYFSGEAVDWSEYPLDYSGYGRFTTTLLNKVSKIPWGQTCSYREAAELAGSPLAWRAAGQALAANRHPIIVPCHRVIGSNRKLGGFSGPAGWKEMLLKLEGGFNGALSFRR